MKKNFDYYCQNSKKKTKGPICGGYPYLKNNYCIAYVESAFGDINEFFSTFPKLYFTLQNKVQIIWFPKDYMYKHDERDDEGNTVFCTSINQESINGNNFSTLGSLFMRHYDIYFDRTNQKISFVRSECEDKAIRSYPVKGIKALVKEVRIMLGSMVNNVGFLSVVC